MHKDPDVFHTQQAMALLKENLCDAMAGAAPAVKARYANALLNVAVHQLIAEEGEPAAATLLWRLADSLTTIGNGVDPVELNRLDG